MELMANDRKKLQVETRPYVWLKLEYERIKTKNPRYSLRAFAKALNIPSGRLSEYLSNKRQITFAVAEQISTNLKFDSDLKTEFMTCVKNYIQNKKGLKKELSQIEKGPKFNFISTDNQDRYRIVADWHHFAILTLMELQSFKSSIKWISKQLGLPEILISESLDRLERLKIIDRSVTPWRLETANLKTSDDIPSEALKEFHAKNLELAIQKLKTVPVQDRDFSAITVAIDKAKLSFVKGMIRDFRRKLTRILEAGENKDEIYQLSIQFFPLNESDSNQE